MSNNCGANKSLTRDAHNHFAISYNLEHGSNSSHDWNCNIKNRGWSQLELWRTEIVDKSKIEDKKQLPLNETNPAAVAVLVEETAPRVITKSAGDVKNASIST